MSSSTSVDYALETDSLVKGEEETNDGRDNDVERGGIWRGLLSFLSLCFTLPGFETESQVNNEDPNPTNSERNDDENPSPTNSERNDDENPSPTNSERNGSENPSPTNSERNDAGDGEYANPTNSESSEEDWKTFVDRSTKIIQWVIGTVLLFVPANYLIQGGGEDKADDDKKPVNLLMALFEEVKSKFPDFFLPTMMGYVGFNVGSLWFKKAKFKKTFELLGIICGCVSVVEILYYVGLEASKYTAIGFGVVFFVLIIGKSIEYFC